jgi:hypothetical protein
VIFARALISHLLIASITEDDVDQERHQPTRKKALPTYVYRPAANGNDSNYHRFDSSGASASQQRLVPSRFATTATPNSQMLLAGPADHEDEPCHPLPAVVVDISNNARSILRCLPRGAATSLWWCGGQTLPSSDHR